MSPVPESGQLGPPLPDDGAWATARQYLARWLEQVLDRLDLAFDVDEYERHGVLVDLEDDLRGDLWTLRAGAWPL